MIFDSFIDLINQWINTKFSFLYLIITLTNYMFLESWERINEDTNDILILIWLIINWLIKIWVSCIRLIWVELSLALSGYLWQQENVLNIFQNLFVCHLYRGDRSAPPPSTSVRKNMAGTIRVKVKIFLSYTNCLIAQLRLSSSTSSRFIWGN